MNEAKAITAEKCVHCGDDCDRMVIYADNQPFCCEGCLSVYKVLNNGSDEQCDIISLQKGKNKISKRARFDYLEEFSVSDKLVEFRNDELTQARLNIPNIHCTSCVWLLEQLPDLNQGIVESRVNFMKKELQVTFKNDSSSVRDVVELLTNIGYEPNFALQNLDSDQKGKSDYSLLLKLGLAGFAFGNIMLFSFPAYLSGDESILGIEFSVLFGLLNIALSTPVLIYSASDYLKSAWASILQKGINLDVPISIGIIALFARSTYEVLSNTGPGYFDSFTGLIFFLLIGKWVQRKTFAQLSFDNDYKSYLPISVLIRKESGEESSTSIENLSIGQEIIVRNQELIPVDSLMQSEEAFIDYSFLTGESEPQKIKKGEIAYAGGKIVGQKADLIVYKEVDQSHLTELWNNTAFEEDKDNRVTTFADRISPYFTAVVLSIAVISAGIWSFYDTSTAISVFTAVLIIACPCALALSTPFTLNAVSNILGQNGIYLKSTTVVERLAKTDTIVFDKTGTITNSKSSKVNFIGDELTGNEQTLVKSICANSSNPLSDKISESYPFILAKKLDDFSEQINRGGSATLNGDNILLGTADYLATEGYDIESTKAFGTSVYLVINGQIKGYYLIESSIRTGVESVLNQLKDQFKTYLLSGDDKKHFELFKSYFNSEQGLLFHQDPQEKLDFIQGLQSENHHVCMVGDGINDAGALQQADFGIAVNDDINSFSPACDAIFEGESLSKLTTVFDFSSKAIKVIIASFIISLLYNITGLGFAVSGQLTPLVAAILMPLSSVTIMIFTYSVTTLVAKRKGLMLWK